MLEYKLKNIARGKADIKIKVLNLENGATVEVGFKSGQKVEEVANHYEDIGFVYFDKRKDQIVLADLETKKRIVVSADMITEEKRHYLSEGLKLRALILEDGGEKIAALEIPITVELEVVQAPPSDKGDTASGGGKPVTLSTGAVLHVPLFIKNGDVIKINTERGEYMERVSGG